MRILALAAILILPLNVQSATPRAFDAFAGRWTGTLEYQDYGGSGRIKIPVKLEVKPINATDASWNFIYDDFGRPVPSNEVHSFVNQTYRVTMDSKGKIEKQTYSSKDFATLAEKGSGRAVLLGSELEDGKMVEVRRTITLEAKRLVTLKETRPKGGAFKFRNQSTYSR
jgi:hypothetical protein